MAQPARIVVAGLGLAGHRHVQAVASVREVELAAVVEPDRRMIRHELARRVPGYASLEQMFAAQQPDGVLLATPTPLHVEHGLACVARRCPLLVEKPIAPSSADAVRLVAAARKAGVPLLVGHHRRHNARAQAARQAIAAGRLGRIRAVQGTFWLYKPDEYFSEAPWRVGAGAGPVLVNAIHDIDLLRFFCGDITSVQAKAVPAVRGYANEDVAAVILDFASGALGTFAVSDSVAAPWSWEHTARENPVYPQASGSCYLIGGSAASLSLPDLQLWSHAGRPHWRTPIGSVALAAAGGDPLHEQLRHFARVIAGTEQPLVSGAEGLLTLQATEAILQAAHSGAQVTVAPAATAA